MTPTRMMGAALAVAIGASACGKRADSVAEKPAPMAERVPTVPTQASSTPAAKPVEEAAPLAAVELSPLPAAPRREEGKIGRRESRLQPLSQAPEGLQSALGGIAGSGAIGDSGGLGGLGVRGTGRGGGGSIGYGSGTGMGIASKSGTIRHYSAGLTASEPVSNAEGYKNHGVNAFIETTQDRLSTFAVDVDTASYAISRRKIVEGVKPPADSVRVEEYLNYFRYSYPSPKDGPLAVQLDAAPSPFDAGRHFLRVGVQGRTLSVSQRKPAHLTFLVDVSGSMHSADKLPLAKKALRVLVDNLRDGDTVALVTYAGAVKDVLPPTGLEHKAKIHGAIEELSAGGSTAMASGLDLAYKHAAAKLGANANSRVIILSDGDANVGPSSHEEIQRIIAKHVKEGVTLSVVGFGMGNYKDDLMEQLADKGNGNYFYCDSFMQAKRIFQEQLGGTLEVIAKDVKLQVEFDPALVKRYRLVGYENRDIADRDFRNDKVDAGEIGSGHTVTALYEVELAEGAASKPFATARVRAKPPKGETASEQAFAFKPDAMASSFDAASKDLRFAVSVAAAAEIFRESPWAKEWSLPKVEQLARQAADGSAERQEFVSLVHRAQSIFTKVAAK